MPATVTHALSMTNANDPAYENQPQHWNSAHALTFAISATEISGLFSNTNGVSFGLSLSSITGSHNALTTAAASDHSHGNPTLNLTNLSGTTASNSAGLTLSLSAAAAGGGATLSGFEPFAMANALTTTWAPANGSWYFQPFVVPQALGSGRINMLFGYNGTSNSILRVSSSANMATNTTNTRRASYTQAHMLALYSRGAGASSTEIESFWSNTWGISVTNSASVTTAGASTIGGTVHLSVNMVTSVGSNGAYTLSQIATTLTRTSAVSNTTSMATSLFSSQMSNLMNSLSGSFVMPFGFNTSINAGHYWLAYAVTTSISTSGTSLQDQWVRANRLDLYGASSMVYRPWNATVSNTSSQWWPGYGVYSASSASPPASVQFTEIRSFGSHITQYFNHINLTHG